MEIKYATDLLIFAIDDKKNDNCRELSKKKLSILLVKRNKEPFKNKWCLPGGFIFDGETSLIGAKRILKKETNLENFYLEQLKTFDDIDRDPRGRIISTAYISLVDKKMIKQSLLPEAEWFGIKTNEEANNIKIILTKDDESLNISLLKTIINEKSNQYEYKLTNSDLAFDHGLIINDGINDLRKKANDSDIIFNMMPDKFTIGELKQVYEIILNKELINSAFRRVIAPKIEPTNEIIKNGGHRPPQYFKYKNNIDNKGD